MTIPSLTPTVIEWRSSLYIPSRRGVPSTDPLIIKQHWRRLTVSAYAARALELMTGKKLNEGNFDTWWARNKNAEECLWYWQRHIERKIRGIEMSRYDIALRKRVLYESIIEQMKSRSVEVEAKIRLLAPLPVRGEHSMKIGEVLEAPRMSLRLKPERLLELLNRSNIWQDIELNRELYNRMVARIGVSADLLFEPRHAKDLQVWLDRERQDLWWSSKAAMIVGISRLLANTDPLRGQVKRTDYLRKAIQTEKDDFTRNRVTREIMRAALKENWSFVKGQCFVERKDTGRTPLVQDVVNFLGLPPLTDDKRDALIDLLLDQRYRTLWTKPSRRMGDDMYRQYAVWSVNAHAGKELITDAEEQALDDPTTAETLLPKILTKVKSLRHLHH